MDIYRRAFGVRLADILHKMGRNQAWLADQMDVKPSTVSRWIQGHDMPERERMATLAQKLGFKSVEEFTGFDTKGRPITAPGTGRRIMQHGRPETHLKGLPAPGFDKASEFLWLYSGLSPERQAIVAMLIYDDPAYVMDVPGIAQVVEQLSRALALRK